ncbi:MAG TPA: hypothetical protein VFL62_15045 [Bradyrhizobium sp.]|uniref:hypothetical protein n=1 Tax=Bradyrhizobium sp. TaxID=376 RepID=UPI002D7E8052|nr:hypothetical protein [Bradyrhizobium sp.]HET7887538.1 hypothetical protein [Bradyrhizobium sp.]
MKKVVWIVAVAIALTAVMPAANAQQADQPKQGLSVKIKQKYLERRAKFVRRVKDIYFAVGCKVLPGDAGTRSRDSYLASVREQAVLDLKEDEELVEAARQAGLERASKPGACDYYRRHPEAAEVMRRTADDAAKQ